MIGILLLVLQINVVEFAIFLMILELLLDIFPAGRAGAPGQRDTKGTVQDAIAALGSGGDGHIALALIAHPHSLLLGLVDHVRIVEDAFSSPVELARTCQSILHHFIT